MTDTVSRLGRQLSEMFRHLPNREEFPDYYQVIASPISLEQIEVGIPWSLHPQLLTL